MSDKRYYAVESTPLNDLVWGTTRRAPFEQMKVGDSFLIPKAHVPAIRTAAGRYGKRERKQFSVRKQSDGEYRCLRVK